MRRWLPAAPRLVDHDALTALSAEDRGAEPRWGSVAGERRSSGRTRPHILRTRLINARLRHPVRSAAPGTASRSARPPAGASTTVRSALRRRAGYRGPPATQRPLGLPECLMHPDRLATGLHDQHLPTADPPLRPPRVDRLQRHPEHGRHVLHGPAPPLTRPPPATAGLPAPTATDAARPPPDRSRPSSDPGPEPLRINTCAPGNPADHKPTKIPDRVPRSSAAIATPGPAGRHHRAAAPTRRVG